MYDCLVEALPLALRSRARFSNPEIRRHTPSAVEKYEDVFLEYNTIVCSTASGELLYEEQRESSNILTEQPSSW